MDDSLVPEGLTQSFVEEMARLSHSRDIPQSWRSFVEDAKKEKRPSWAREDWPLVPGSEREDLILGNQEIDAPLSSRNPQASNTPPVVPEQNNVTQGDRRVGSVLSTSSSKDIIESLAISRLVAAYRARGHLAARLDPLELASQIPHLDLSYKHYGFSESDLDRTFFVDGAFNCTHAKLRDLLVWLENAYCKTFAVEFSHISNPAMRDWVQVRIERQTGAPALDPSIKKEILSALVRAEGFASFCNMKYAGAKRFGIEGAESLIPALESFIRTAARMNVKEICIGMAHRARLNVLVNILQKPYRAIFNQFMGGNSQPDGARGTGDVKYHEGSSTNRDIDGRVVHLSLSANPSHLEVVDPVVLGKVRAKQDFLKDRERSLVVPLLIHGDASFAGQGVVAECFGLSELSGSRTGGSVHIIVNNQIGFTASPIQTRSSPYPSELAKMVSAPIFHVNGDDPEAVVRAATLALEYRQIFKRSVVIDMFCYRRLGHNETDEPMFTQPLMYKKIKQHAGTLSLYAERLKQESVVSQEECEANKKSFKSYLEEEFKLAPAYKPQKVDWLEGAWEGFTSPDKAGLAEDTGVSEEDLKEIAAQTSFLPKGFVAHSAIKRFMEKRNTDVVEEGHSIDWSNAENLAFGSLMYEKFGVRLCGQDSQRGTFSQRHAVVVDQDTDHHYTPLKSLACEGTFRVINSMLSEYAVLGFEYGYSLALPKALVLWEAQFGDFANGAQVVIDQFISGGEYKWLRLSGLVMLLPHGYEGQGPEHSSARLERYLQMCAQNNMQVANCTTPANYFHILRRQMHRSYRRPLVLMTPKSLLRHKKCISSLKDFAPKTHFLPLLEDDSQPRSRKDKSAFVLEGDHKVRRVILCSGKVYYDLEEAREVRGVRDIYIARVEELYPFPEKELIALLKRFKNPEIIWCQEEPRNMGAWSFVAQYIDALLKDKRVRYVGRAASASTASGWMTRHLQERDAFLAEALA